MTTRYKIPTKVTRVELKSVTVRTKLDATGKVDATTKKIGWWVSLQGSWESIYLGPERPDLYEGQEVMLSIEGAHEQHSE